MNFSAIEKRIPGFQQGGIWRLLILCSLVGLVAGLGAVGFYYLLSLSKLLFFGHLAGYHPLGPGGEPELFEAPAVEFKRWILLFLPAVGGLISGVIVFSLAPEAEGHGTDAAIDSYLNKGGQVRARVPIIKAITSAITIGSGGSAGREGPIAQIGAGFGSLMASWLGLSSNERRVLMAAGMGAGIGAIFHAPLAGALFAAEVLYRELDLEYEVLLPTVISSIVAYAVFAWHFGWDPLFLTPSFSFTNPLQLLPYLVLALAAAIGAIAYSYSFYGVRDLFAAWRIPNHFKPMFGGLIVGVFGFFLPEALGSGYGILQEGFNGNIAIGLFLAVAVGKIATTSFSIASGGSGGVFGPAVVIGGAIGGVIGVLAQQVFPSMDIQPGAFVLVGMAGFFAAAANTPISTIIMVSEMTGNYHLLVPSMWVCFIAYALAKRTGIYEKQVKTRMQAPAHMGEMMHAILDKLTVREAVDCTNPAHTRTILINTPISRLIEIFASSKKDSLPVVNGEDELIGVVDGRHLRANIMQLDQSPLILAADIMEEPVTVTPGDTLLLAIERMSRHSLGEVIVVDPLNEKRFTTILGRNDIVNTYYDVIASGLVKSPSL